MATGSVLYVTQSTDVNGAAFVPAQKFAIDQQLPFAVVYCMEQEDADEQMKILAQFRPLESFLQQYSIPFMVLIGQRDKVLPWMSGHVSPKRIFTADDGLEQADLQKHPVIWPGRVMTIAELQAMISGDQSYCMPN